MRHWNYRALATINNGKLLIAIHEVFYKKEHIPEGATVNPITVSGESVEDLKMALDRMKEALDKPILWGDERFPQEYQP